jgi:hypothetical protein
VTSGKTVKSNPASATCRFEPSIVMRMPIARGRSAGQPSWTRPLSPTCGTENGCSAIAAASTRRAENSG